MKPNVSAIYRQAEDLKLIELEDLMENLECLRQTKTEQEAIFEKSVEDEDGNEIGTYNEVKPLAPNDLDFFIQD